MPDPITRLNAALEGRYRIERELGEGGMATVYLAADLRHERKVALKVLKPELAAVVGAERFLAEIKTTANLQHPHILPLFDSGEADTFLFYVMPYVEGESLRERLDREHQLPVEEAVGIATNVAEALDYAHSQGVIHRDIKPANVLLQAGKPVISDFGIALAVGIAGGGRLTETGLSLGTPHYMSPEQATGDLSVGAATDIYALGCVLYEMLVGEPPYTGSTPQAILGKIIAGELSSARNQRASVPANVEAAICKALEKVPADRFTSAQEVAKALADPAFRYGEAPSDGPSPVSRHWRTVAITSAIAAGGAALWIGSSIGGSSGPPGAVGPAGSESALRLQVTLPEGVTIPMETGVPALVVSPDGSRLVFVGEQEGVRRLYSRLWTEAEARPIDGTEGAGGPFFSPDGEWIGYYDGWRLTKLSVSGGTPVPLHEVTPLGITRGAAWVGDSTFIFAPSSNGGLMLGSSSGSALGSFTDWQLNFTAIETPASSPAVVGDQPSVLFARTAGTNPEDAQIAMASVPLGDIQVLLTGGISPRYSSSGHLLFVRGSTLYAASFDGVEGEVQGSARELIDGVLSEGSGAVHYSVGGRGVLAYLAGGAVSAERELVWVNRAGEVEEIIRGERDYVTPRLSPDGGRLAVAVSESAGIDLWVHDFARGVFTRRTTHPGEDFDPAGSPDGTVLAYASEISEPEEVGPVITWISESAEEPEKILSSPDFGSFELPGSWSPDGRWLTYTARRSGRQADVFLLPTVEPHDPVPFVETPANERGAMFSPDGNWIAYVSDESGQDEVYVRPVFGPGPAILISIDGGDEPLWARDGTELFYRSRNRMMAVSVDVAGGLAPGPPVELFSGRFEKRTFGGEFANYDISVDGSRFVMVRRTNSVNPDVVQVVMNWPALLGEDGEGVGGR